MIEEFLREEKKMSILVLKIKDNSTQITSIHKLLSPSQVQVKTDTPLSSQS